MSDDVTRFLAELGREDRAARTIEAYGSDLRAFAEWFASSVSETFAAATITPTDVRDYRSHLQTVAGASPSTINRRLAALRRFCQWAKASGLVSEVSTDRVKNVAAQELAPRSLSKRDVEKFVRAVERHGERRDLAVVLVLRHTGIRVGELCALRLGDVSIGERKGSLTVRSGKGSKFRVVPLNVDARRAIRDYLAVRPVVAHDSLFVGQRGDGIQPRGVELLMARYGRLAGVEATPHVLRHSFARHSLDAGASLVDVAAALGHRSLTTTAKYTKPSMADLERLVERLETT